MMYYSINFNDKREFDVIPFGGHVSVQPYDKEALVLTENVKGDIYVQQIVGKNSTFYVRVSSTSYPKTKAYSFKISDYEKLAVDNI